MRRLPSGPAGLLLLVGCLGAPGIAAAWTYTTPGAVDGMAAGDVDGDGRLELAVLVRGGTYDATGNVPAAGTLMLLDASGTLRWQTQSPNGAELAGHPVLADFDGDGMDEIAYCETDPAGVCQVLEGDGTLRFETGACFYPGLTTAGPAAADLNGDGADELIVASYGGELAAFDVRAGLPLWTHSLWSTVQDGVFGHPAVGDVDGDGHPDVVVTTFWDGGVHVLDGATGAYRWGHTFFAAGAGHFPWASGPALVDLDQDGGLEIVVTFSGTWNTDGSVGSRAAVIALDNDFQAANPVLWHVEPLHADGWSQDFSFMSPVATRLERDGPMVVLAQSFFGLLVALDAATGAELGRFDAGTAVWATPALADWDGDGVPEVLAAGQGVLSVLQGETLTRLDTLTLPGGVMPTPVIADLERDGSVEIVAAAWGEPVQVFSQAGTRAIYRWNGLGGGKAHAGRLDLVDPAASDFQDAGEQLDYLYDLLAAQNASSTVLSNVATAQREMLRESPADALQKLETAVPAMTDVESRRYTALIGRRILAEFIDRAGAIMGRHHASVVAAEAGLATMDGHLAAAAYETALGDGHQAAKDLAQVLKWVVGDCTRRPTHVWHVQLCRIVALHDAIPPAAPGTAFTKARSDLETAASRLAVMDFFGSINALKSAVGNLYAAGSDERIPILEATELGRDIARAYIDHVASSGLKDGSLDAAETYWATGVAEMAQGAVTAALTSFGNAVQQARPTAAG